MHDGDFRRYVGGGDRAADVRSGLASDRDAIVDCVDGRGRDDGKDRAGKKVGGEGYVTIIARPSRREEEAE